MSGVTVAQMILIRRRDMRVAGAIGRGCMDLVILNDRRNLLAERRVELAQRLFGVGIELLEEGCAETKRRQRLGGEKRLQLGKRDRLDRSGVDVGEMAERRMEVLGNSVVGRRNGRAMGVEALTPHGGVSALRLEQSDRDQPDRELDALATHAEKSPTRRLLRRANHPVYPLKMQPPACKRLNTS